MTASSSPASGLASTPRRSRAQPSAATRATAAPASRTAPYHRVREAWWSDGNSRATVTSWASSTPPLRASSASSEVGPWSPRSVRMPAKARPCTRPNAPATSTSPSRASGRTACTAATPTDAAMSTSTGALGTDTQPSAQAISVSECPTVEAVTTRSTRPSVGTTPSRRRHRRQHRCPGRPAARSAAAALGRGPAAHRRRGRRPGRARREQRRRRRPRCGDDRGGGPVSAVVSLVGVLAALPQLLGVLVDRTGTCRRRPARRRRPW